MVLVQVQASPTSKSGLLPFTTHFLPNSASLARSWAPASTVQTPDLSNWTSRVCAEAQARPWGWWLPCNITAAQVLQTLPVQSSHTHAPLSPSAVTAPPLLLQPPCGPISTMASYCLSHNKATVLLQKPDHISAVFKMRCFPQQLE